MIKKTVAGIAIAGLAVGAALAGGMAEPVEEMPMAEVMGDTAAASSSSGGLIVPLIILALIAAAMGGGSEESEALGGINVGWTG